METWALRDRGGRRVVYRGRVKACMLCVGVLWRDRGCIERGAVEGRLAGECLIAGWLQGM